MKLTYWYVVNLADKNSYSIRARTRREALAERALWGKEADRRFGPVTKCVVEYRDAFDLLSHCLGEGGVAAESRAQNAIQGSYDTDEES